MASSAHSPRVTGGGLLVYFFAQSVAYTTISFLLTYADIQNCRGGIDGLFIVAICTSCRRRDGGTCRSEEAKSIQLGDSIAEAGAIDRLHCTKIMAQYPQRLNR